MAITNIHSAGRPTDSRADNGLQEPAARSAKAREGAVDSARTAERSLSVEERRQQAFRTVEQTLTMGYQKLAAKYGSPAQAFDQFEPLSAEKVAGNILGFIERRLVQDAAEGATEAQLKERLAQGLAGFEKGFAEARKQLEALASFTPEIDADINDTRDRVLSGIEALRQRIIDQQLTDRPEGDSANVDKGATGAAPASYVYEQARASEFRFELTTAEGDQVSIRASSHAGVSMRGAGSEATLSASANRSLSWSVAGDLNTDERHAIESLLGEVDHLAEQFFAGDLPGAMASAMDLGYDQRQVAAFSLNLSQSSIRQVSETYGRDAAGPAPGAGLQERLAPVGQFLRDLETALADAARVSQQPQALLLDVAERMASPTGAASGPGQSLRDFMADMLATLTTDSVTGDEPPRTPDETTERPGEA